MTKKHYELIAHTIAVLRHNHHISEKAHNQIVDEFAYQLRKTNPKFDRNRFLTACGICDGKHESIDAIIKCEVCTNDPLLN